MYRLVYDGILRYHDYHRVSPYYKDQVSIHSVGLSNNNLRFESYSSEAESSQIPSSESESTEILFVVPHLFQFSVRIPDGEQNPSSSALVASSEI